MRIAKMAFFIVLAGTLAAAFPALAVSTATARSSGVQAIHTGPGLGYPIVGKLANQERVRLAVCTRHSRWCKVVQLDGGPSGWVMGSYLIGSPAKLEVTPDEFMIHFGFLDHWPFDHHPR